MKTLANSIFGIASFLLAFGFWGMAFPEFTFTTDTITVFSEDGTQLSDEDFAHFQREHHIYYEIGTSAPEQIQLKSRVIEWIGEQIHGK